MSGPDGPRATDGTPDDERIFDAMPPAPGRGFAQTWWGRRWLQALEDTALDSAQLRKGRAYARQGAVGAVSVRPGRITAVVRDRDGTAHRADVLLQQLSGDDWDRLLGMAAGEAGHIAALLDGEMPTNLVEDAAGAGVELLPGIGDLDPECTCEAWDHCLHTTALSYQTARLLDQDPFVLMLMRGRGERALLEDLQTRSTVLAADRSPREPSGGSGEGPGDADGADGEAGAQGVPAVEAFALGGVLPPLPGPPLPVDSPGKAPALDGGTPPAPGVDTPALEFLVSDTALRAQRMLGEALSPGHADSPLPGQPTVGQDAVRLAAGRPSGAVAARLATGSGRTPSRLQLAVRAWEYGGRSGLSVLEDEWSPDPESLARARDQLAAAWTEDGTRPQLRATRNRWTAVGTDAQLRFGRDGQWWPYRRERGVWWPAGGAEHDPAAALAGLLEQDREA